MPAEGIGVLDSAASPLRSTHRNAPQCCCGHPECEFLKQNASALQDLENDVRQAATMGQVRALLFLLYHYVCKSYEK